MKILILPNSFKGSLSARQTARVLSTALKKQHLVKSFPLSDGGDGFIDLWRALFPSSQTVRLRTENAFGKKVCATYLWLPNTKTAIIETARICGLGNAKKEELDPLHASSFGVGKTMLHAIKKGAKKIYIGLGGVACNDGGAGIAQALGARFLAKDKSELPLGAQPLFYLNHLDLSDLQKQIKNIKIYAVADVTNPMLGPKGSARIFGPQKGATSKQVETLEKALSVYARVVKKATGKDIARTPSTAAAGALCAGLYGLLNAEIILGADFLQKHLPLNKWTKWADLLITSEGKLDRQTLFGKAPSCVLNIAAKYKKPVCFICGFYEEKIIHNLPRNLSLTLISLSDFAKNQSDSMLHCRRYLLQAIRTI
ncbi:MAG: glycerate kinase [Elusimicrobiaceae bacterium]|nr:glycerate kinase [Elusimicrobiaceae bacterium]